MHAEHLRVVLVRGAPDLPQQRTVRHQPAPVAHQGPQQLEPGRRQMDFVAVHANAVSRLFEREPARSADPR